MVWKDGHAELICVAGYIIVEIYFSPFPAMFSLKNSSELSGVNALSAYFMTLDEKYDNKV